jgi:hypothetical protein
MFFASLLSDIKSLVLPSLSELHDIILLITTETRKFHINNFDKCKHIIMANVLMPFSPTIMIVYLRIISLVHALITSDITATMLVTTSHMCIEDVLACDNISQSIAIQLPSAPLLWKEGLVEYTFMNLMESESHLYGHSNKKRNQHNDLVMTSIFYLLESPVSEIREGVLQGIYRYIKHMDIPHNVVENVENTVVGPTSGIMLNLLGENAKVHGVGDNINQIRTHVILDEKYDILQRLLRRISFEIEPPLVEISLQLLWR